MSRAQCICVAYDSDTEEHFLFKTSSIIWNCNTDSTFTVNYELVCFIHSYYNLPELKDLYGVKSKTCIYGIVSGSKGQSKVKVKLNLYTSRHEAIRVMEVGLHAFLFWALDGIE